MKWTFNLLVLILMTTACQFKDDNDKVLAKVYDAELTSSDFYRTLNKQGAISDTAKFKEIYINNWIENEIQVHNAKLVKLNKQEIISDKIENYKNQLLVHYFQNQIIKERLDTNIANSEIITYFENHKSEFLLKDYLVKVLYIKVSSDAPELEKIGNWYKLRAESDEMNIIQYAGLYASNFYYDKDNWIYFDEITKEIPLSDINKDRFIPKKSEIKFQENGYYYFLNILDFKLKNATSPIEFQKDNIKKRILNSRVLKLRESITTELIQKANNENAIKKY
ncbi:MAG: hypothetical protein AB8B74_04760 [Crocinitomicaceae bacterium]